MKARQTGDGQATDSSDRVQPLYHRYLNLPPPALCCSTSFLICCPCSSPHHRAELRISLVLLRFALSSIDWLVVLQHFSHSSTSHDSSTPLPSCRGVASEDLSRPKVARPTFQPSHSRMRTIFSLLTRSPPPLLHLGTLSHRRSRHPESRSALLLRPVLPHFLLGLRLLPHPHRYRSLPRHQPHWP